MGRLAILVLLVALAVMAEAHHDDSQGSHLDDNQYGDRRGCRLTGHHVQRCQQYLQRGHPSEEGMEASGRGGSQDQSLRNCCRELRQLEDRCRCRAIEQALNEARRQQGQEGERSDRQGHGGYQSGDREMLQRAQNLPNTCGLDRPQYCQIRGSHN